MFSKLFSKTVLLEGSGWPNSSTSNNRWSWGCTLTFYQLGGPELGGSGPWGPALSGGWMRSAQAACRSRPSSTKQLCFPWKELKFGSFLIYVQWALGINRSSVFNTVDVVCSEPPEQSLSTSRPAYDRRGSRLVSVAVIGLHLITASTWWTNMAGLNKTTSHKDWLLTNFLIYSLKASAQGSNNGQFSTLPPKLLIPFRPRMTEVVVTVFG